MTDLTGKPFIAHGAHSDPSEGRCALEWVAWIAGETHSDYPICVSPELRRLGVWLNDSAYHVAGDYSDKLRQELQPYLPRMLNTAFDGLAAARRERINELSRAVGSGPNTGTVGLSESRWRSFLNLLDEILPSEVELEPSQAERALAFCNAGEKGVR